MLVFNEGVPRSGKSYDAVKHHILPALREGRRVYARLNGLRYELIAQYLEMSEARIRELLFVVNTDDVLNTFVCYRDEVDGEWCIEDSFKDVLIVIDEVHEFYVESRAPLAPQIENFWALLGQNGGDAVLMTQWIKRMHPAIRARIERKHSFQKLTVVGLKNRYRVTYYHTVAAGKFEKVGSQTFKYDASIFPLYDGYAPGARNTEVYSQGKRTVWAVMLIKAIFFLAVGVVGFHFYSRFFRSTSLSAHNVSSSSSSGVGQVFKPGQVVSGPVHQDVSAPVVPPVDPLSDLGPEQRYIFDLNAKGRLRLAALAQVGHEYRAWVQWINTENLVIEQLDLEQLRALGFDVSVHSYGVRISVLSHVLVATAWPWREPVRETDPRLYNLSRDQQGAGSIASAASDASGAPAVQGSMIEKGERAMGTFPESPGYEHRDDLGRVSSFSR